RSRYRVLPTGASRFPSLRPVAQRDVSSSSGRPGPQPRVHHGRIRRLGQLAELHSACSHHARQPILCPSSAASLGTPRFLRLERPGGSGLQFPGPSPVSRPLAPAVSRYHNSQRSTQLPKRFVAPPDRATTQLGRSPTVGGGQPVSRQRPPVPA